MFEGKKEERKKRVARPGHDQKNHDCYIAYERCSLTYNPYQLTTAGSCHQICPRRLTQLQTPQKRGHAAFCLSRTNARGSTAANWPVPIQPLGGLSHARSSLVAASRTLKDDTRCSEFPHALMCATQEHSCLLPAARSGTT